MAGVEYNNLLFASQVISTGGTVDDLFTLSNTNESVDDLVINVSNFNTTSTITFSAWCQLSSGAEDDADKFISNYPISANDSREFNCPRMIGGGTKAKLSVTASASGATVSLVRGVKRTT